MGKGPTRSGAPMRAGMAGAPQIPNWGQAAPGSAMVGGIPQQNTAVLDKWGLPTITPEMRQQAAYVPPPPRDILSSLLAPSPFGPYTMENGLLGYNYRGGANKSFGGGSPGTGGAYGGMGGGGYTTSGGGYGGVGGYGEGKAGSGWGGWGGGNKSSKGSGGLY